MTGAETEGKRGVPTWKRGLVWVERVMTGRSLAGSPADGPTKGRVAR